MFGTMNVAACRMDTHWMPHVSFLTMMYAICQCLHMLMMLQESPCASQRKIAPKRLQTSTRPWIPRWKPLLLRKIKANKNMWSFLAVLAAKLTTKPFMLILPCPDTQDSVQDILVGSNIIQGNTTMKLGMRLRKAQQSWLRMGSFWFRAPVQTRGKLVIYQGVVYNTLLSGLESLVLDTKHLSLLDRKVLVHGRKLMGGKACQKEMQADGTVKFIACHSNTVWKFLGLVPSSIELRIRRLRWYQNLASNMELHKSVIVAMFGRLDCENAAWDTCYNGPGWKDS